MHPAHDCQSLEVHPHAVRRMYERNITREEVETTVAMGQLIRPYPDDRPFPSYLFLAFPGGRPLHILVAHDAERHHCLVITVYEPDPLKWSADFTTKITSV